MIAGRTLSTPLLGHGSVPEPDLLCVELPTCLFDQLMIHARYADEKLDVANGTGEEGLYQIKPRNQKWPPLDHDGGASRFAGKQTR